MQEVQDNSTVTLMQMLNRVCPGRRSIFTWSIRAPLSPGWAWSARRSIARHRASRSGCRPPPRRLSLARGMIETSDAAGAPCPLSPRTFSRHLHNREPYASAERRVRYALVI
ncbi:unnamed protein product [Colias eurytheme]|nr:unnamed protein product [Colias eurytheme]